MEVSSSGHSFYGIVNSAQEAHAVLEASKQGFLPRVTRRLTDEERVRFVRAGAVFVWEEEEAGIRRWTDHIKWSPSRVSGAFLTYTEVPSRGDDTLIKQSFSATDAQGTKMHLIAYASKAAFSSGDFPTVSEDPVLRQIIAQRAARDPREVQPLIPPHSLSASTRAPTSSSGAPALSPSSSVVTPSYFPSSSAGPSMPGTVTPRPSPPATDWTPSGESPSRYFQPERPTRAPSYPPLLSPSYGGLSPFHPGSAESDDPPPRQLPSIRVPDAGRASVPLPLLAPLRGTFVDEEEEHLSGTEVYRGSEDERQLRLLGRSI